MVVAAFAEVGRSAREVLVGTREGVYSFDQKATLTTKTSDGVGLVLGAIRAGDKADLTLKTTYSRDGFDLNALFKTGSDSVDVIARADNLAPGLRASISATLPDTQSGKLTLDYNHPFGHATAAVGLGARPKASLALTTAVYTNFLLGVEGAVDVSKSSGGLDDYGVVAGYMGPDSQIALRLTDRLSTARLSVVHNYARGKALAAEVSRPLQGSAVSVDFAVGIQQRLNNGALFKAKVDHLGVASLLYQQTLQGGERATLAAQLDAVSPGSKPPKVGLAFDLA